MYNDRVVKMNKSYGVPPVLVAKFNVEKGSIVDLAEKNLFRWGQERFQNGRRRMLKF